MNLDLFNEMFLLLAIIPVIANLLLIKQLKQQTTHIADSHSKTLAMIEFLRLQQSRAATIKAKQALVEKTVNTSTVAVETIHQSISDAAFNVINNLSPNEKAKSRNQKIRTLHDQTSSDVYKSVKVVNKQVGAITEAFLSTRKSTRRRKSAPLPAAEPHADKED